MLKICDTRKSGLTKKFEVFIEQNEMTIERTRDEMRTWSEKNETVFERGG